MEWCGHSPPQLWQVFELGTCLLEFRRRYDGIAWGRVCVKFMSAEFSAEDTHVFSIPLAWELLSSNARPLLSSFSQVRSGSRRANLRNLLDEQC